MSGGMRTSTMATSGRWFPTASTSEGASPTAATTSSPASSRTWIRPTRRRTASSPITTRKGAPPSHWSARCGDSVHASIRRALTRSESPQRPPPGDMVAPPTPLSRTSTTRRLFWRAMVTCARVAFACLAMLVRASAPRSRRRFPRPWAVVWTSQLRARPGSGNAPPRLTTPRRGHDR